MSMGFTTTVGTADSRITQLTGVKPDPTSGSILDRHTTPIYQSTT